MVKLFFDVCAVGPRAIKTIESATDLHALDIEVAHLTSYFPANTPDESWISTISEEGWIVITADRGKHSRVGEKLPELCLDYQITHVLMSKSINQMSNYHRVAAIIENLDGIILCDEAKKGSRFHLRGTQGKAIATLAQVEVQIPEVSKKQRTLDLEIDDDTG